MTEVEANDTVPLVPLVLPVIVSAWPDSPGPALSLPSGLIVTGVLTGVDALSVPAVGESFTA